MIFERVKEEVRGGRSVMPGIATGYKRGFAAIVDANVVTFMTAFILFVLATAEVQGFAFTLGIGVLVSLFTAVLATQAVLGAMGRTQARHAPRGARRRRRGPQWTFDFMGASRWFFTLSGVILLVGALAIGGRGLNFGIDFKSGTQIQTGFVSSTSARRRSRTRCRKLRLPERRGPEDTRTRASASNGFQISTKTLRAGRRSTKSNKGLAQVRAAQHFSLDTRSGRRSGKRSRTAR